MRPGVTIRKTYEDNDIIEVHVYASSSLFSGYAEAYFTPHYFDSIAKRMRSFPTDISDHISIVGGKFRYDIDVSLQIFVRDSTGHISIECQLRGPAEIEPSEAKFVIHTEVSQINEASASLSRFSQKNAFPEVAILHFQEST